MTPPIGASLSNYEIRAEGWRVLTLRLGVSGAMRFLMEYDPGRGDYARERDRLLAPVTLDAALRAIQGGRGPTRRRRVRRPGTR